MDSKMKSRWVHCPICGGKTRTKVYEDTVLVEFPLYCPKCKREILIDVVKLKMVPGKKRRLKRQSGYSQSASLLAHNRIAASQLIRSGLYHS